MAQRTYHEMDKVDGGTEKVDGRNGRKGWRRTGGEEGQIERGEDVDLSVGRRFTRHGKRTTSRCGNEI